MNNIFLEKTEDLFKSGQEIFWKILKFLGFGQVQKKFSQIEI